MRRYLLLLGILAVAACTGGEEEPPMDEAMEAEAPAVSAEEAAAEAALAELAERYAVVEAALADGFIQDPTGACVTAGMVGLPAEQGAMGVHYLHPARLGLDMEAEVPTGDDATIEWTQPEVLVYEPQADGTEQLVAIEYLVFERPWLEAGNPAPPNYFGEEFVHMADDPATEQDEAHGIDAHYELHVWVPRENPTGRFMEFNPNVTCEHAPAPAAMGDMG